MKHSLPQFLLDLSWVSSVISCSPGQATCQNLWSTPYGFRFHPAGAVTKINDLIFVVLAEWQQLRPGWLTLSAVCHSWRSPLPISQIALILRSLPPPAHPATRTRRSKVVASSGAGGTVFIPPGVRTCKAMSKCAERIPRILLLGPGGLVWCWVPGIEGRGAGGNRQPTQQLTPPLISISSCSHKPKLSDFSAWQPHKQIFPRGLHGVCQLFASKEQLAVVRTWHKPNFNPQRSQCLILSSAEVKKQIVSEI